MDPVTVIAGLIGVVSTVVDMMDRLAAQTKMDDEQWEAYITQRNAIRQQIVALAMAPAAQPDQPSLNE